jgi:hypothetical protein
MRVVVLALTRLPTARLVLKSNNPEIVKDPEAINMLYMQSVNDIVTAKYPVKETALVILAALQLQATFGDYQPDSHGGGWLVYVAARFTSSGRLGRWAC